ncbi:MAG: hypothetical protein HYU31_06015 [Deltaproteobacteria bacterium]|nr:hypothetical protein [Deltaproteobacteria bacterium]
MELYELLALVVETFTRLGVPYLVTGSVASMAYGEPRLTNDIDIVAGIREEHIPSLVAAFPADVFYLSAAAIQEAIRRQGQFNIIHPGSGLKVDVIIRKETPFDRSRFARARVIRPAESYEATFAAAEDVIIKKMEYYREGGSDKHLRDITGILKVSAQEIDEGYIVEWSERLGLRPIWEMIKRRMADTPEEKR